VASYYEMLDGTRTWAAHVPTDAPPQVKALLARLQSG
jgi:hypothetical protein